MFILFSEATFLYRKSDLLFKLNPFFVDDWTQMVLNLKILFIKTKEKCSQPKNTKKKHRKKRRIVDFWNNDNFDCL